MWKSWKSEAHGLEIKDIIWPGDSHVPPQVDLKGLLALFHVTLHAKMAISDSQRSVPFKTMLCLIKYKLEIHF